MYKKGTYISNKENITIQPQTGFFLSPSKLQLMSCQTSRYMQPTIFSLEKKLNYDNLT